MKTKFISKDDRNTHHIPYIVCLLLLFVTQVAASFIPACLQAYTYANSFMQIGVEVFTPVFILIQAVFGVFIFEILIRVYFNLARYFSRGGMNMYFYEFGYSLRFYAMAKNLLVGALSVLIMVHSLTLVFVVILSDLVCSMLVYGIFAKNFLTKRIEPMFRGRVLLCLAIPFLLLCLFNLVGGLII